MTKVHMVHEYIVTPWILFAERYDLSDIDIHFTVVQIMVFMTYRCYATVLVTKYIAPLIYLLSLKVMPEVSGRAHFHEAQRLVSVVDH